MASKASGFKRKFDKIKAESDALFDEFKVIRRKLNSLVKKSNNLTKDGSIPEDCDFDTFTLLSDYSIFVGESVEDIYATMYNMKKSSFGKVIPRDRRKKVCYERNSYNLL